MQIHKLSRSAIIDEQWDNTVLSAYNVMPYGLSWYLDAVADSWDAIVLGNYDWVMPLPFTLKFGVKMYSQPPFCQQLGPFGKTKPSQKIIKLFVEALPLNALRLSLNFSEDLILNTPSLKFLERTNQLLEIEKPLDEIELNFNRSVRRNIKSGQEKMTGLEEIFDPQLVIEFYQKNLDKKVKLKEKDYKKALTLFEAARANNMMQFYQIRSKDNDEVTARGAFLIGPNRVYNLFSSSLNDKINKGAASYLIYLVIEAFAGKKKYFDFEGSSIPSIQKYFASFGAISKTYQRLDRMHPILKLIHKAKMNLRT